MTTRPTIGGAHAPAEKKTPLPEHCAALLKEQAKPARGTASEMLGHVVAFQEALGAIAEQAAVEHRLLTVARTMDESGALQGEAEPTNQALKAIKRLTQEIDDKALQLVTAIRQLEATRIRMRESVRQAGHVLPED
jgi:predicted  nucleic acid-binding Zn-ribbon protein